MEDIIKELSLNGVVPVVEIEREEDALPLARALAAGGLWCAEITMRTQAALAAVRQITREMPKMLVGAGTVLSVEQADEALAAGAKFIVAPGFNPKVVEHCLKKGVPVIPGCSGPSDVEQALSFGLGAVKFFPAEASGGMKAVKALSAPYHNIKFMPTGGVNPENLTDYLSCGSVFACGGSWMVKKDLINAKRFDEIERLAREAVAQVLGFSLAHIGINAEDDEEASAVADDFSRIFGFGKRETPVSFFVGSGIEVMKDDVPGAKGHIGVSTRSIVRAIYYLKRNGVEFDEQHARRDKNGDIFLIYLKDKIGGFTVHLVQEGH